MTSSKNVNAPDQGGKDGKADCAQQAEFCFDAPPPVKHLPTVSSPREIRLLRTLLEGTRSRETLDRAIGASNSPDIVFRLRNKGFGIRCERREVIDRDGHVCRSGWYSFDSDGAALARAVLAMEGNDE